MIQNVDNNEERHSPVKLAQEFFFQFLPSLDTSKQDSMCIQYSRLGVFF